MKSLRSALRIGCALLLPVLMTGCGRDVEYYGAAVTIMPEEVTSIDGLSVDARDELFAAYDMALGMMPSWESEAAHEEESQLNKAKEWQFESKADYSMEANRDGVYVGEAGDINVTIAPVSNVEDAIILAGADGNKRDITTEIRTGQDNEQLRAIYAEAMLKENVPQFGYYAVYELEDEPNAGYSVSVNGAGSLETLIREATAICMSFEAQG